MEPQEGGLRPDALQHSHLSRQEEQPVDVKKYANNPNTKQPISQSLRNAIAADSKWDQQADQTISDAIFSEVEEQILADLSKLKHPYHDKQHTQNVIAGVTELAELAGLDEAEKQLLRVAALFHDYDHAGNTFRQTVADAVRNDISNEEYAAIKADEAVGQYLSVPQRLQLQGIILATSFAQSNPDNLPDSSYQRDYAPTTKLEKFTAFADINNLNDSLADWMNENFAVFSESGRGGIPADFDGYLENRLSFLKYVQMRLDDVTPFIADESADEFQRLLDNRVAEISEMKDTSSSSRAEYAGTFEQVRVRRLEELDRLEK